MTQAARGRFQEKRLVKFVVSQSHSNFASRSAQSSVEKEK